MACATVAIAGCGGKDFQNKPRPPVPVQLTAVVTDKSVTVSPNRVGAGPIILIVSNQSRTAHTVTLEGEGGQASDKVGPVNPLDVAQIQQTVQPGRYTVSAGSQDTDTIAPGTLTVGRQRRSSSDTLLQP